MILSYEELLEALENTKPLTPEEKKKLEEVGKRALKRSPQEARELRRQMDKEDGFC